MDIKLPKEVKIILDKFVAANYQIYIVGGAVRDLLMSQEVKDWDFTTDAKPEQIQKLLPESFYNNQFGTVGLLVEGAIFEITTMRKEGDYKDHRHPDHISWTDKIEEDLARRDFTINAVALTARTKLIDPYNGQADITSKLIRAVGDPNQRFKEDALRILRLFRFVSQLGFDVDPATFETAKQNRGLLVDISWERIREEFFKLLVGSNPYIGMSKMREAGTLKLILPEVERCFGVSQQGPKHDREYDVGEHSLLTLKETISPDPLVRFAALLHDIGKPDTLAIQDDGNTTFYNHDVVGGRLVMQIAKRFKLSNKQTDKLFRLVRWHLFTVDEHQTDAAIRRFIKNVGKEDIVDMMALRVGDRLGGGTQKAVSWRMEEFIKRIEEVSKKPFLVTDLKINGQDVMKELGIPPSPKVGDILNLLFQEVLEDSSKNKREYLLTRLKEIR